MKNDMSQTATTKYGEKDNENDEAMVDKALEDLDHLNQQIHNRKMHRKIHRKIQQCLQQIIIMK